MESITVNLIPDGRPPVVHASQFDVGREFRINLTNGFVPYVFTGTETVTLYIRKPDNNLVSESLTYTQDTSYVDIETTEQMTACYGACNCELRLEDSGNDLGTLDFILNVERSPADGGVQSETELNNLKTQIINLIETDSDVQNAITNLINS